MACTASGLLGLKDFPKGLRVLVVDEDKDSAAEIRSKLEEMDYVVSIFRNESEALSAISSKLQIFHVAIIGVSSENNNGSFKFLKHAKDLPTIMTSNIHCLNTMMQCIAHGAVEFLRKPLSEDKLRNIWQHVVHKAFNAGGNNLAESLMPIKESVTSTLQPKLEHKEPEETETENEIKVHENVLELSSGSDRFPAPTTPQLKYGGRLLDEVDCLEQTNCPTEKEDGECKSVDTTCANAATKMSCEASPLERSKETLANEESDCVDGTISESNVSTKPQQKNGTSGTCGGGGDFQNHNKVSTRGNRKKIKVDWTPELHKKFVQAVEQLGVDQAIPSRILDCMKVQGLTRHNVASHLQKYRIHRRHILPKEDDRRWSYPRDLNQRGYHQHQTVMPFPQYHLQQALQHNQAHPLWPQPGVQYWGPAGYPTWHSSESWQWNPYPTVHADAWGCPVMPPPHGVYSSFSQNAAGYQSFPGLDNGYTTLNSFDIYPEEEMIDKVVKEAMSKPWLPLPLGLKPPSTESVVAELYRQGIPKIPPQQHNS